MKKILSTIMLLLVISSNFFYYSFVVEMEIIMENTETIEEIKKLDKPYKIGTLSKMGLDIKSDIQTKSENNYSRKNALFLGYKGNFC